MKSKNKSTSWGRVADWYDDYLQKDDTYQSKVIWPNIERIISDASTGRKEPAVVCDIACGQGYFSHKLAEKGYRVTGIDISNELIKIASDTAKGRVYPIDPVFGVADSHDIQLISDTSIDICICILALQNIKLLDETYKEVARILRDEGKFIFVINHPSFRIPQYSDWEYSQKTHTQSRIISKYLLESTIKIDMHPGKKGQKTYTTSFHRPLQTFIKLLLKHGLAISRLEEWSSHKKTPSGPRSEAENLARKEIPLFMCIEVIKQVR